MIPGPHHARPRAKPLRLWKLDRITGYWELQRDCDPREGHEWLKIFQADEPTALFKLSYKKPR